jgi:hypothetical protein
MAISVSLSSESLEHIFRKMAEWCRHRRVYTGISQGVRVVIYKFWKVPVAALGMPNHRI